jgi:hypothetical protein
MQLRLLTFRYISLCIPRTTQYVFLFKNVDSLSVWQSSKALG